jgi:hypothetical protein
MAPLYRKYEDEKRVKAERNSRSNNTVRMVAKNIWPIGGKITFLLYHLVDVGMKKTSWEAP